MAFFQGEKNGAGQDVAGAGVGAFGEQTITKSKIGVSVPIELQSIDKVVNVSSVSCFVLDLVQQHVVDVIRKNAVENSDVNKNIRGFRKELQTKSQEIAALRTPDKDKNQKNKKPEALKLDPSVTDALTEKLGEIEDIYAEIVEAKHQIVRKQIMSDVEAYAPVLQLIVLNSEDKTWWEDCDGWPEKEILEKALPTKTIVRRLSFEEINAIFSTFWQKNDPASVRQVFFNLAGLATTATEPSTGEN